MNQSNLPDEKGLIPNKSHLDVEEFNPLRIIVIYQEGYDRDRRRWLLLLLLLLFIICCCCCMTMFMLYTNNTNPPTPTLTPTAIPTDEIIYATQTAEWEYSFITPTHTSTPTPTRDLFTYLLKNPSETPTLVYTETYTATATFTAAATATATETLTPTPTVPVIIIEDIILENLVWYVVTDGLDPAFGVNRPDYVDLFSFDLISDNLTATVEVWIGINLGDPEIVFFSCDLTASAPPRFSYLCDVSAQNAEGNYDHRVIRDIMNLHFVADPIWPAP